MVLERMRLKKRYVLDQPMAAKLQTKYRSHYPITLDLLRHCEIVEIERGMPFVIMAEEDGDRFFLELLTEADGGLEWTIV